MEIREEDLDYGQYIKQFAGVLTGDTRKDAYWHNQMLSVHSAAVANSMLNTIGNVAQFTVGLREAAGDEAITHLNFGALRRLNFIWHSLRGVTSIVQPDRDQPLINGDSNQIGRDLNAIYINIRGTLDNFAWALIFLFGDDDMAKMPRSAISLFGKKFVHRINIPEIDDLVDEFSNWHHTDMQGRRDPAAHQIPLTVPPAVLDADAQAEYERLSDKYNETMARTAEALAKGEDANPLLSEIEKIQDRQQRVGSFMPVFVHHPNAAQIPIYPTLPNDVGQLIKITNRLLGIITAKLPEIKKPD